MAVAPTLAPWIVPAQRAAVAVDDATAGTSWHVVGSIAVGPGGVFALHHGQRRKPYVLEARALAQQTERDLADKLGRRVPVTGLVTARGVVKAFGTKAGPDGGPVVVVGRRGVSRWLHQAEAVLAPAEVIEIREALAAPAPAPKKKRAPRKQAVAA